MLVTVITAGRVLPQGVFRLGRPDASGYLGGWKQPLNRLRTTEAVLGLRPLRHVQLLAPEKLLAAFERGQLRERRRRDSDADGPRPARRRSRNTPLGSRKEATERCSVVSLADAGKKNSPAGPGFDERGNSYPFRNSSLTWRAQRCVSAQTGKIPFVRKSSRRTAPKILDGRAERGYHRFVARESDRVHLGALQARHDPQKQIMAIYPLPNLRVDVAPQSNRRSRASRPVPRAARAGYLRKLPR